MNTGSPAYSSSIHPVHAVLLAGMLPLFVGSLLSDWAYASSYQVQWKNFASWLNAGALIFAGLALLAAAVEAIRGGLRRRSRKWLYIGLLVATFVVGFVNALVHAKDAWSAMPEGLILSAVVAALALAAIWVGFSAQRAGEEA